MRRIVPLRRLARDLRTAIPQPCLPRGEIYWTVIVPSSARRNVVHERLDHRGGAQHVDPKDALPIRKLEAAETGAALADNSCVAEKHIDRFALQLFTKRSGLVERGNVQLEDARAGLAE